MFAVSSLALGTTLPYFYFRVTRALWRSYGSIRRSDSKPSSSGSFAAAECSQWTTILQALSGISTVALLSGLALYASGHLSYYLQGWIIFFDALTNGAYAVVLAGDRTTMSAAVAGSIPCEQPSASDARCEFPKRTGTPWFAQYVF